MAKTPDEKAAEAKAKAEAKKAEAQAEANAQSETTEATKAPEAKAPTVDEDGFSFPEFEGHLATVEKKVKGTYTDVDKTVYRHKAPVPIFDQETFDRLSKNGFLKVVPNPAYSRHVSERSAAQLAFYKNRSK